MSNWELVPENENVPASNAQWELVPEGEFPMQEEGFGMSALKAIPRIGKDIIQFGGQQLGKIPEYYQSLTSELPGFLGTGKDQRLPLQQLSNMSLSQFPSFEGTVYQHPGHLAMQGLAGTQELINSLAQLPLNLAKYGSSGRLNLLPESVPNAIAKITPEDTTEAINQLFGEPQYPGEALLRGVTKNALNLYGAGKIGAAIAPQKFLTTQKTLKNTILGTHDALENKAIKGFDTVANEMKNRNISNIPTHGIQFNEIEQFFPKTKQVTKLLNDAKSGNFEALRNLQSELYNRGKKNLKSNLETERMRGEEMFDHREDINQAISDHLLNTGNSDLNDMLNVARSDYKKLKDIYYNKNMNRSIIKMVDKDTRKVPKNLANILNEESKPMQRLKEFHPGLQERLSRYNLKQTAINPLKKIAIPSAVGALGVGAGYGGYKYLKEHENK